LKYHKCPKKKGWTPLMIALHGKHLELASLLVERGADYTLTTKVPFTHNLVAQTGETTFDCCKDQETLSFIKNLLNLERVKMKFPQKLPKKSPTPKSKSNSGIKSNPPS
jgi:ankyrin repeat protein